MTVVHDGTPTDEGGENPMVWQGPPDDEADPDPDPDPDPGGENEARGPSDAPGSGSRS
jgi:hypothetical protein